MRLLVCTHLGVDAGPGGSFSKVWLEGEGVVAVRYRIGDVANDWLPTAVLLIRRAVLAVGIRL